MNSRSYCKEDRGSLVWSEPSILVQFLHMPTDWGAKVLAVNERLDSFFGKRNQTTAINKTDLNFTMKSEQKIVITLFGQKWNMATSGNIYFFWSKVFFVCFVLHQWQSNGNSMFYQGSASFLFGDGMTLPGALLFPTNLLVI